MNKSRIASHIEEYIRGIPSRSHSAYLISGRNIISCYLGNIVKLKAVA